MSLSVATIVKMLVRTTAISAHFVHQGQMSFSALCAMSRLARLQWGGGAAVPPEVHEGGKTND